MGLNSDGVKLLHRTVEATSCCFIWIINIKGKGKAYPTTGHEGPEGE
jgi:hypothetical protein